MKYRIVIFTLLVFSYLLNSCKRNEEVSPDLVMLRFTISSDIEEAVTGAKIYLFYDSTDFKNSRKKFKAVNSIDSTISAGGKASIKVDPNHKYWMLIVYKDPVRRISLINNGYDKVIDDLRKNINVSVDIKLTPVEGSFAFWTAHANSLPVTINVGSETFLLDGSLSQVPQNAAQQNIALASLEGGEYKYYAKNDKGCAWAGRITVKNGGFVPVELDNCENGEVVFYADGNNTDYVPIQVTINEVFDIGTIDKVRNIPYTCGDADRSNVLSTSMQPGIYTYLAKSSDGNFVWTGSFTITSNSCTSVLLKKVK